jgi:hypothetical protein
MIRAALLLALACAHTACSADTPTGNSVAANAAHNGMPNYPDRGTTSPMSQTRIVISTDRGTVTAELVDNDATRELVRMLPLMIEMRDHLRQEKTGNLPSPLPESPRQTDFSAGTLGLWGNDDFVIYYSGGRVPEPGIVVLGRVTGDLSVFNNPHPVTIRLLHAD